MPRAPLMTPEQRVKAARAIGRKATQAANTVLANEEASRSTKTRTAYKIKAEALDKMMTALDGIAV